MTWIQDHYIEIFGAITGIIYVFLEIKRNIWLWPLGIVTSVVYIFVFYDSEFYADMGLQWYYLVISIYGWVIWSRSMKRRVGEGESGRRGAGEKERRGEEEKEQGANCLPAVRESKELVINNIELRMTIILSLISAALFIGIWFILDRFTDSTIPGWDAFTTAISIIATWMLARKIIEHWILWIIADIVSMGLYIYKGLYPTVILFMVYTIMAFIGYREWNKVMHIKKLNSSEL